MVLELRTEEIRYRKLAVGRHKELSITNLP